MAIIQINRVCKECEITRTAVRELRSDVEKALLDYKSLYQTVRVNLAKLAKQADGPCEDAPESTNDSMGRYRRMLIERKIGRSGV